MHIDEPPREPDKERDPIPPAPDDATAFSPDLPTETGLNVFRISTADLDSIPFVLPAEGDAGPLPSLSSRETRPRPGFWGALLWSFAYFLLTNVTVAVSYLVFHTVRIAISKSAPYGQKETTPSDIDLGGLAIRGAFLASEFVAFIFVLAVIGAVVRKGWSRKLAVRLPSVTHVVLALISLPSFVLITNVLYESAREVVHGYGYQQDLEKMFSGWPWWFGILVVGLAPAVNEELWCRGFLGRGLVGRYGPVLGVLMTSLIFGALHGDPPHVVATFYMGLALHVFYLWTRSILIPMLLHFLNNSWAVLATQVQEVKNVNDVNEPTPFSVYLGALALWAAVGWALYRTRARIVARGDGDQAGWEPGFPGVELPPAQTDATITRARLGWSNTLVVLAGMILFVLGLYWGDFLPSLWQGKE
jgi:uncharacterized protein